MLTRLILVLPLKVCVSLLDVFRQRSIECVDLCKTRDDLSALYPIVLSRLDGI